MIRVTEINKVTFIKFNLVTLSKFDFNQTNLAP